MDSLSIADNVLPRRMSKNIDRLVNSHGVSRLALDSALNLVNPFPDYNAPKVGWPEPRGTSSVIVEDTQLIDLSAPASVTSADTWSAHVSILPTAFTSNQLFTASISSIGVNTSGNATRNVYPLSILAKNDSSAGGLDPLADNPETKTGLSFGSLAEGSAFRIVKQAVEIINTTASIYRGGYVDTYRFNSGDAPFYSQQSSAAQMAGVCRAVGRPPSTSNAIVNLPNYYGGDATEGAYVINLPDSAENLVQPQVGSQVLFLTQPGAASSTGFTLFGCGFTGWNFSGAFLSGLTAQSTFKIRFRTTLEIFPTPSDGNSFLRLTQLSTPWDPVVMHILSEVLREMPAACAYTDNPLGEWFHKILAVVADHAPLVGAAFGPAGSLIGTGVSALAKGIRHATTPTPPSPPNDNSTTRPLDNKSSALPSSESRQPPPRGRSRTRRPASMAPSTRSRSRVRKP